MKKINVETMTCFQQVADVIGKEKAKVDLFKVVEKFNDDYGFNVEDLIGEDLVHSFSWESSPQGYNFWYNIGDGIDPYEEECK